MKHLNEMLVEAKNDNNDELAQVLLTLFDDFSDKYPDDDFDEDNFYRWASDMDLKSMFDLDDESFKEFAEKLIEGFKSLQEDPFKDDSGDDDSVNELEK